MERWQDQGIVLALRPHGENGGIVSILTENNGRHAGYVRGARASKMRGVLEIGNIIDIDWQARIADQLGTLTPELIHAPAARVMQDKNRLSALQSACALCDAALPEREGHAGLFHGLKTMLDHLEGPIWAEAYVLWEIALLRELGFPLDLSRCAAGGDTADLAFVSPRTGRAVSRTHGMAYREKLLELPHFLRPVPSLEKTDDNQDITNGLRLSGYFLEHWVFAHHTRGIPEIRQRLQTAFEVPIQCLSDAMSGR